MDDLCTMANIANAGTDSRRVFYSEQIASIMAEIEQKQARERLHRQAIAEGRAAVRVAQERRRIHAAQRKAQRHMKHIALISALILSLAMLLIPGLVCLL